MINQLIPQLKSLKLGGILDTLEVRNKEALTRKITYIEFLTLLMQDEIERRNQARFSRKLRKANFNPDKTLEGFDFEFNPAVDKKQIFDLATCHYIGRKENIWLLGQSGVGKTHLAQSFAHEACRRDIDVVFTTADRMVRDINGGRADGTFNQRISKYTRPPLLIVDEFALKLFKVQEAEDFYEVINQRCERGSTIITSNRTQEEWPEVFGDSLLASATIDRLTFRAHKIEIVGPSYRSDRNRKNKKGKR
jgi:DNA replication protein DnaC